MTHRGKRSRVKQQEKKLIYNIHVAAIKTIFHKAKVDNTKAEIINTLNTSEVINELNSTFGTLIMSAIPDLPKGIVLIDSRGNGVFQQITIQHKLEHPLHAYIPQETKQRFRPTEM